MFTAIPILRRAPADAWPQAYVEGCLSLNAWTGRDGAERTGLAVMAWRVEVLGRIGKSRPAKAPKAERELAEEFDDAITF